MPAVSRRLLAIRTHQFRQRQAWKKKLGQHLHRLHDLHVTNARIQHGFLKCARICSSTWLGLLLVFVSWRILSDLVVGYIPTTEVSHFNGWNLWICEF
jgi:hypothetical protein